MKGRIKVAVVITRLDLGGAQQVALETAKRLDPERFEAFLVAGPGGMLDQEAEAALGSRFVRLPWLKHPISPLWDLLATLRLAWFFAGRRVDVVHTHSSKAGLVGRAAAWMAGVPLVAHTVHGWSFHDAMGRRARAAYAALERLLAGVTDLLVCVAASVRDKGLLNRIGRPEQYRVVRAAVDLPAWRGAARHRASARRELGLKPGEALVGCVANCKPQKNPLDFVRVARRVLESHPRTRFVYLGDGPLRPEAEALARSWGLSDRVRFLGWRGDAARLASAFDLFLLTSRWEGLPCVLPQAFCLGLPVVATDVDGAPELVREGRSGYLCQSGDVEALAGRVGLLLAEPARRRAMGRAGRASLGPEWGFGDMVRRCEGLYQAARKA